MPNFGPDDPLSAAVAGRGGLYNLSTATQPGQGALDVRTQPDPESRRDYLVNSLQNIRDHRQLRATVAELRAIDRSAALNDAQLRFEANQRRMMAHDAVSQSYHQLSTDRETEIDEQGHALLQTMGHLDSALRRGEINKDQYDEGLLQAGQQFPLGTRHPEAARHYEFAITEADKQNAFNARRELTQVAKIGAKYGIDPQFDPETGRPSIQLTQQAALQTPKGKNEALGQMNHEMAAKYGVPTGVSSLFNPIAPHVGTDAEGNQVENPTHVALPFLDQKTNAIGKLPVPVERFNQMKADFGDRYFALNPQTQPAGAVPGPQSNAAPADALDQGYTQKVKLVGGGVPATWSPTGKQFPEPVVLADSNAPLVPVRMKSPSGQVRDVDPSQVDHFTKLGATVENQ